MSKIAIFSPRLVEELAAVMLVSDVIDLPLLKAKRLLSLSPAKPLYCVEFFLNEHDDRDREIRSLIQGLAALGVELQVLERSLL